MLAVQLGMLIVGVVVGPILALWLRRQIRARPEAVGQRIRLMIAFGTGAVLWVGWPFFFLSSDIALLFLGTVAAIYLPSLFVIATTTPDAVPRVSDDAAP